MIKAGIYFIINLLNGMIYVGSSINLLKRWKEHLYSLDLNSHPNRHLQRAWNKYGSEVFQFTIVEIVEDISKLLKIEQLWIDASNCCNREVGYNLNPTAGSLLGFRWPEGTNWQIGRKLSDDHKLNMSLSRKGFRHSEEAKLKMSISKIGNKLKLGLKQSKEEIEKRINSLKRNGYKPSVETKLKISVSLKNKFSQVGNSL